MTAHTNRLANEKSPYLLQHANNPVDWHPWGDEAFEKAGRADKPVFLSIGYATCHWCHVMEHESFESAEIAALLNEAFVCIKVDREERPDIDSIYMTVCQMMTGQGGWPLTILMTPDRKPFYAATYIPPESRYGRIGMKQLIARISEVWNTRRQEVIDSAGEITRTLAMQTAQSDPGRLDAKVAQLGYRALMAEYDADHGGFGGAPKFPTPHKLIFLLRSGDEKALKAVEHTLEAMRKGGLFDQIGFGFHRYSTDAEWLLPHFEKMLYDQAMLTLAYAEAYALTGKLLYRAVAEEVLLYVLRDMKSPEGGFYSAEDADSDGEEGLFYLWDAKEMQDVLGEDFEYAASWWNITAEGNFHDEATGRRTGRNIPHYAELPDGADHERLAGLKERVFEVREQRSHPLKDTKILTDWNGLMIAALAKAGLAFGISEYIDAAEEALLFIENRMRAEDGRLWHRFRDGHTAVPGQLDDYAFLIFGLLELYSATLNPVYLGKALDYDKILKVAFLDDSAGGYYMTADDAEELIVRPKSLHDGAVPSGNSIQMYNLLRMARLTGRFELEQEAGDVGNAFGGIIQRAPAGFAQALIAVQFASEKSAEIVVVGERNNEATVKMLEYINSVYRPGMVVVLKDPADSGRLAALAPFTRSLEMQDGKATVYICRNFTCEKPITSLEELKAAFK